MNATGDTSFRTPALSAEETLARMDADELRAQLRALQSVTEATLAHLVLPELLAELLGRLRELLSVDTATVLLCTEGGEVLQVRASSGLEEEVENQVRIPMGKGIAGTVAVRRQAVIVDDVSQVTTASPFLRRLSSMMVAPLLANGDLLGILHVGTLRPRHFGDSELYLMQVVADRVALAIKNALTHDHLEEANRAKSEFLARMSHELRTPLNAVLGYADLLASGVPEVIPPAAMRQVERIRFASLHLLSLIEGVLTFARLEAGREPARLRPFDARTVLGEARAIVEPLADAKGLRLRVVLPDEPLPVVSDPAGVRRILVNLLDNAVKFTAEGEVELRAWTEAEGLLVRVRDTGPGIPAEHQRSIFAPFWQVDSSSTRTAEGTGLGLTVAEGLARSLGGELSVESEPPGGAAFTLRLPLSAPAPFAGAGES